MPSMPRIALAAALRLLLPNATLGQTPPFTYFGKVGEAFFNVHANEEASGLTIAPDGSHLVVVDDGGKVFFLNLLDYTSGHCMLDITDYNLVNGDDDFEGVAIDTGIWDPNNKHAYVVHEGKENEAPLLFKINYVYDNNGSCSITVASRTSLEGAMPCLQTGNGIESFDLKTPSTATHPAVFFAGIQDTGKVYEVTSEGWSTGPGSCYDAGLEKDDVSASSYDGQYLWSIIDNDDKLVVMDPSRYCTLAKYDLPANIFDQYDEEGLVVDAANGHMYVAVDGQGNYPSFVSVYNFTYPADIGDCLEPAWAEDCTAFDVCGATFPPTPAAAPATTTAGTGVTTTAATATTTTAATTAATSTTTTSTTTFVTTTKAAKRARLLRNDW